MAGLPPFPVHVHGQAGNVSVPSSEQSETNNEKERFEKEISITNDENEALSWSVQKARSPRSSHYMLTFENGFQDDSDPEIEEITKPLERISDQNSNIVQKNECSEFTNDKISSTSMTRIIGVGSLSIEAFSSSDAENTDVFSLDGDFVERSSMHGFQSRTSNSDMEGESSGDQLESGDFLQMDDHRHHSVRPGTPTVSGYQSEISVDGHQDSEPETPILKFKPLSGSTTAMCGSVESLTPSINEVQLRRQRFPSTEHVMGPPPVESFFGPLHRRRAFHGSMNKLPASAVQAYHSMSCVSDDECSSTGMKGPRYGKVGPSHRWSLASSGTTALDEVRLLQNQLENVEKELKRKDKAYQQELVELRKENERQQKLIGQSLTLGPEAKIEATMQHEITRMTAENLDLRETIDKQSEQIRKLKKMLKIYAKKLKDGEAAEIAAELEQDEKDKGGATMGATVKLRERTYMGMFEYRREDEGALIKNLILELKPKVAAGLIPGLPSYVLFMCVRHTDYINDDDKVKALLTGTINGIKKVVKKHTDDLERVTLWLANTCRLMHTLKQYSGDKQFQVDNQPRQNEMCLRNFDLSEYRQVFSDLAIWIYQTLIKFMQELLQPSIVPAILEHEAIAGLTASKPSGLRGRSSSNARDLDDGKEDAHSLDALMRTLNSYMRILTQHAVDPELVKQIFRQLYYFMCAGALNNLLLRKDMCNWSKGMQIRYNLSHMEQWLRDNKLQESGAQLALDPIVQASQLLQARKTDSDVESICEMCSKLTIAQIIKILNLYTPVDEFEERVPISFIRKIQSRLKSRPDAAAAGSNTLLMDTKFTYPVTFPFNPSSILLDSVEVPEQLHLGFLKKL